MKASIGVLVATLVSSVVLVFAPSAGYVDAAPLGDDEVIAFEVRGVGNGHGRGLSQWGAYGRAVNGGQTWTQILDAYYGGTSLGSRIAPNLRVRLTGWDGFGTVGVISRTGTARWNSSTTNYASLYAKETSPGVFSVFGSSGVACPGAADLVVPFIDLENGDINDDVKSLQNFLAYFGYQPGPVDGWFGNQTEAAVKLFQVDVGLANDVLLASGLWRSEEATAAQTMVDDDDTAVTWLPVATGVAGPIVFSTTGSQAASAPGDVLGLCKSSGAVTHYRGAIEVRDVAGSNRVVNQLDVENYLRGVVPKEVSASWGDAGGGAGMNALKAQAVAARSYALSQSRYTYAQTCDTSSCQVYGGAGTRVSATAVGFSLIEKTNTNTAIAQTAGKVRLWANGSIVSTEFSASNGPRTAGGQFPAVDDPFDDVPGNPNHRWTRVIDADKIMSKYGLSSANGVVTQPDRGSLYDGIWANEVHLGNGSTVSTWDFRNAFVLPSPGFELIPIRRMVSSQTSFAFIGDSVGESVAGASTSPFRVLLEGVFASSYFDSRGGRPTAGAWDDGVVAAGKVPIGTELVVVELGYNDTPSAMSGRIDAVMSTLRARDVGLVVWVGVSERIEAYSTTNAALDAATDRWNDLVILDWDRASAHHAADRWLYDDIHLTATGKAEFSVWLRDHVIRIAAEDYNPPRRLAGGVVLRVPVLGAVLDDGSRVPESGVAGVALNVTSVLPVAAGHLQVWDCAVAKPETSSVNYLAGSVEPNAVVVGLAAGSGEVCVSSLVETDVIVDVSAWFGSGVKSAAGRIVDTRDGSRLAGGVVLRVPVLGAVLDDGSRVPESGVAGVALNVTSVLPVAAGHLQVWDCAVAKPETSSVNYLAGSVEPNAVVVGLAAGSGEVCVSSLVETDVIVDVSAWFGSGVKSAAGRIVDTRDGSRLAGGVVLRVPVLGAVLDDGSRVPESGVAGVALNVTSVLPVAAGHLQVWDCAVAKPETSSVNYLAGSVEPNAVVVGLAAGSGEVCVSSLVETDVIVDVSAWFGSGVKSAAGRIVDTRFA